MKVIKSGLSEGRRGGSIGCCEINMAGLAAVPALLVGPARTIQRRGAGGRTLQYKMADHSRPLNTPEICQYFVLILVNIVNIIVLIFYSLWG